MPTADRASESAARLDALRAHGADRLDPLRFAYLEALARRAEKQPEAIRRPLLDKIAAAADELAARQRLAPAVANHPAAAPSNSPLAELLAYIGEHAIAPPAARSAPGIAQPAAPAPPEPRGGAAPELKSVAYFRDTWSKLSTEQQLTQTLAQAPANAGPMNSQHLVLCALQAMRDVSPDYLQGFMSYVDTLVWLEQATSAKPSRPPAGEGEKKAKAPKRSSNKH